MSLATMLVRLSALLAVAACGAVRLPPAPTARAPSAVLLPLATGNEWVYDVRNGTGEVARLTMRVRGERYIASRGMPATIVEERGGVPGVASLETTTDLVAYYLRGGFIFRSAWLMPRDSELDDRGAELGDERLLPVDPERDREWQSAYALFDFGTRPSEMHESSRVVSQRETIRVPAGAFPGCARIETTVVAESPSDTGPRQVIHHHVEWYAAGIGLVKSEAFVSEGDRQLKVGSAELVSFRVAGAR
jgi:hypothetical protein